MKTVLLYIAVFFLWLTTGLNLSKAGSPPPGNLLPDLVEKVLPSVVNIASTNFVRSWVLRGMPEFFGMLGIPEERVQQQSSLGSGFVWDKSGYVITNNHVIENAQEVVVTFYDKRRVPARIVGRDPVLDVALLQLKSNSPEAIPVKTGDSDRVRIAESVFAIGNPMGLQHTVTSGIISAKHRTIGLGALDSLLQTDASINFGNSGGPLFNLNAEVIGINTATRADAQLISFAIPINDALEVLEQLKKYGQVVRAWLGIMGEQISTALQRHYDLPVAYGVVITRLVQNSPAHLIGLHPGDIIVKINDIEVHEKTDLMRVVARLKPGTKVKLSINRQGLSMVKEFGAKSAPVSSSKLPEGII